ncbi:MAG: hypothetical protein AB1349_08980 [Elusimicrobiota bacterium]
MDKKLVSYIGLAVGVILILFGGGLLYLKEKKVKKVTAITTPTIPKVKKIEVVISSPPAIVKSQPQVASVSATTTQPASLAQKKLAKKTKVAVHSAPFKPRLSVTSSNLPRRKIAFQYRSSKPKSVYLIGDFNNWNPKANPMKQGKNYTWETMLLLPPGEYKYAFLLDGAKQINDPNSKKTVRLRSGKASILVVKEK